MTDQDRKPRSSSDPPVLSPVPAQGDDPSLARGEKGSAERRIVTYEARFDIERLAGGKRFQGCILYLDDGRELVTAYRAIREYFKFVDKRVRVTGYHYTNPPDVQQIMADHFQVTAMALAPGETPYPAEPTELPAPPRVRTWEELRARDGRWVTLRGRPGPGRKHADDDWVDVDVKLEDGSVATASVYRSVQEKVWRPLEGRWCTVISRVRVPEPPRRRALLVGQTSICEGEVKRCGMDKSVAN